MVVETPTRAPSTGPPFPHLVNTYLAPNAIHQGDARQLLRCIEPESVALSFWSPPYFVGKSYEKLMTFQEWQDLLCAVIRDHFAATKPGGFLAINISDILAFADASMPKIMANKVNHRSPVTREQVLAAKAEHPEMNRYQHD